MRNSFDAYMRSKGRDPTKIWTQVEEAISSLILNKEHFIIDAVGYSLTIFVENAFINLTLPCVSA